MKDIIYYLNNNVEPKQDGTFEERCAWHLKNSSVGDFSEFMTNDLRFMDCEAMMMACAVYNELYLKCFSKYPNFNAI